MHAVAVLVGLLVAFIMVDDWLGSNEPPPGKDPDHER